MKLDFNLHLTQKQGLALTAQVQQAIKLLHMTNLEIQEFVGEQFQDNPFVETNMDFKEKDVKLQNPAEVGGVDKTLEENPYKQSQNENKLTQDNQFETGDAYIPDQL